MYKIELLNFFFSFEIMFTVGSTFPKMELDACVSLTPNQEFAKISTHAHSEKNQWLVIFFYPKDFTSVCFSELHHFNQRITEFEERDAQVMSVSTDSAVSHLAWRKENDTMNGLAFPMLADEDKKLSQELGIMSKVAPLVLRATYIVDEKGIIRWMSVYDLGIGRNIDEVLRVLDALQVGKSCPADWRKGQETV